MFATNSTTCWLAPLDRELIRHAQSYLAEMINGRKYSDEKDEKRDLLSNLLNANEELLDDGEQMLGEVELIGA